MLMNPEIWPAILYTANVAILATTVSLTVLMSYNIQYLNKLLYYLVTVNISQKCNTKRRIVTSCITRRLTMYPQFFLRKFHCNFTLEKGLEKYPFQGVDPRPYLICTPPRKPPSLFPLVPSD